MTPLVGLPHAGRQSSRGHRSRGPRDARRRVVGTVKALTCALLVVGLLLWVSLVWGAVSLVGPIAVKALVFGVLVGVPVLTLFFMVRGVAADMLREAERLAAERRERDEDGGVGP